MNTTIITLEATERILTVVHRHWLTLWLRLFSIVVFTILPLVAWVVILIAAGTLPTLPYDIAVYTPHFMVLYCSWLVFMLMAVGQLLLNHYLDVWVVTNERIVSVDQQGFFNRTIGSFRLDRLQDINVEIHGVIATLLDYGTVEVETASEGPSEFRAYNIPHPQQLKTIIMEAADTLPARPL